MDRAEIRAPRGLRRARSRVRGPLCRTILVVLGGLSLVSAAIGSPSPAASVEELQALVREGKYEDAEQSARALLAEVESASGPASAEAAEVLDVLVESRWRAGKIGEAETVRLAERAIEIKTRVLGPEHVALAESLNNLAVISYFTGDYAKAGELWEKALRIRERALGPDHPDVAQMLNNLANLLQTIGDYAGARPLYERAVSIREQTLGPEHPAVADSLNNLGVLLEVTGDYTAARPLLERAIEIKRQALGPDHPKVASSINALSVVMTNLGDYEAEIELLEEARRIWEKSLGPEHQHVGSVLNNLAEAHRKTGDYEAARPLYDRAIEIWQNAFGAEHPRVARGLDNLADLYVAIGNEAEARTIYERTLAIREKTLGGEHPEVAESLTSLAVLLSAGGEFSQARPLLRRAVEIRQQSLGAEHPSVAESMNGLATLLAATGERDAAIELAIESERIARDHLRLTGRSLSEKQALRYAAVRNRGLDLALTLSEQTGDPRIRREVLDTLTRSRAVILDAMAARRRSVNLAADPEIARLAEELARARARLANLTVKGLGGMDVEEYRKLLDEARADKERAEGALAAASVDFAREQERGRVGLDEVTKNLPANSALVCYFLYDRTIFPAPKTGQQQNTPPQAASLSTTPFYGAVILRGPASPPVTVSLGAAEEIDGLVRRWKTRVTSAARFQSSAEAEERVYRDVAGELRRVIWDPLEERVGRAERVFIVPDGSLNLVSFGALPVGPSEYLIETGPLLHYVSAERDLVPGSGAAPRGRGLLVLGGPNYDDASLFSDERTIAAPAARAGGGSVAALGPRTRSGCGDYDSLHFDALPAAAIEAEEIVELWKSSEEDVVLLRGSGATEPELKRGAPGKRILHLATHGFFLGGECATGYERIRGSRGLTLTQEPEPFSLTGLSPLLLSGLALAGANHRERAASGERDGILTAEEIASLDLAGVEWAVLSACDTGVGEIQSGEGVFGLRRAIQVAGVRTLIMSLWPVDDEATRAWMRALYAARLNQGLDSAQAVRSASLTLLAQRRGQGDSTHPFFWAAFVAAGDWR